MSGSAGAQFRLGAIKRLSRHVDRGREPVGESKVRKERECRLLHGHVNVTKAVGLFDHAHDHVHVELHTMSALAGEPFVLPPRQAVPVYHDLVLRACREAGFAPNAPHEADHVLLLLGMVAAGEATASRSSPPTSLGSAAHPGTARVFQAP